jgi:hypothetical protein|tara:strand:- start:113 stop:370 length:258 start_codon:yes stop_codon:yes gene_type:complete
MSNQKPETPMKLTIDLSKPKGERETLVPLTAEEIAETEKEAADYAVRKSLEEAEATQKATDAQAGRDALVALGLTEAQITALVGA